MGILILKIIFLVIAIMYTFTCIARVCKNNNVYSSQTLLMAVGIVGFIALQFWM